ncbi:MAG: hypothetical protein HY815_24985 [Candidatus Riflebacteria bacterium]|nr:hypothetical protein [Candidatus Riflebacteria bacterium]
MPTLRLGCLVVAVALLGAGALPAADQQQGPLPFLVIGHRGAPGVLPENTLPSFQQALAQGANAVELDVCLTKDDRIVLWHDYKHSQAVALVRELGLEPGMRYRPWVPDLWSKLRRPTYELDLGQFLANYGYTLRFMPVGTQVHSRITPPTLDEFAGWAARAPGLVRFFLDVKVPDDMPDVARRFGSACFDVLSRAGVDQKAVLMPTSRGVLTQLMSVRGGSRASFCLDHEIVSLTPDPERFGVSVEGLPEGCEYVSIGKPRIGLRPWRTFKNVVKKDLRYLKNLYQKARERLGGERRLDLVGVQSETVAPDGPRARGQASGVLPSNLPDAARLIGWTINDADEMRELMEVGVGGIVTDKVPRLVEVVGSAATR